MLFMRLAPGILIKLYYRVADFQTTAKDNQPQAGSLVPLGCGGGRWAVVLEISAAGFWCPP